MERFTQKDSTYYEKALARLQELENKLENGQLIEIRNPSEREYMFDTIEKRNIYLMQRYGDRFREEYGIKDKDYSQDNLQRIAKAYEEIDKIMKEEMPLMWYEYCYATNGDK